MAKINKTGITNGSTIQAEHITRVIDALSGGSTDTIVATGSFSGSLAGEAVTAKTLAIGPTSQYTINQAASTLILNNQNDTLDTIIKHYNGFVSSSLLFDGLSVNGKIRATSFTGSMLGTASYATTALSASYAANVPATASYALAALSSSYAVTASYALNAGGSGTGFPFTGSAQITGSMGITGSLRIGTASNQYALLVTGSTFTSGSFIGFAGQLDTATNLTANKNGIINLAGLGGSGYNGKFVLPNAQPDQPVAGSVYWDDESQTLWIYSDAGTAWYRVTLTI